MESHILQNQLVIMQTLLNLTQSKEDFKRLRDQIALTKEQIKTLS